VYSQQKLEGVITSWKSRFMALHSQ